VVAIFDGLFADWRLDGVSLDAIVLVEHRLAIVPPKVGQLDVFVELDSAVSHLWFS